MKNDVSDCVFDVISSMFFVRRHNGELERLGMLQLRKVRSYPSTCPSRYASRKKVKCRRM